MRVSTVEALCRELGLELHVGPPRAPDVSFVPGDAALRELLDAIAKTYLGSSTDTQRKILLVSLRTLRDSLDDWIAGRAQMVEEDDEVLGPSAGEPASDGSEED